jgi:hypothetical protein
MHNNMSSSVVVGNQAYIVGSLFFMKFTTNQLDIYDRATKKWKTETLLNAKFAMATTSYKNNALFIGDTEGLAPIRYQVAKSLMLKRMQNEC